METVGPKNKNILSSRFVGRRDERIKRISWAQSSRDWTSLFLGLIDRSGFSTKVMTLCALAKGTFWISSELPTMSWQIVSCVPWQMAPAAAARRCWWDSLSRMCTIACCPSSTLKLHNVQHGSIPLFHYFFLGVIGILGGSWCSTQVVHLEPNVCCARIAVMPELQLSIIFLELINLSINPSVRLYCYLNMWK